MNTFTSRITFTFLLFTLSLQSIGQTVNDIVLKLNQAQKSYQVINDKLGGMRGRSTSYANQCASGLHTEAVSLGRKLNSILNDVDNLWQNKNRLTSLSESFKYDINNVIKSNDKLKREALRFRKTSSSNYKSRKEYFYNTQKAYNRMVDNLQDAITLIKKLRVEEKQYIGKW